MKEEINMNKKLIVKTGKYIAIEGSKTLLVSAILAVAMGFLKDKDSLKGMTIEKFIEGGIDR